jgi:hypothetical protein
MPPIPPFPHVQHQQERSEKEFLESGTGPFIFWVAVVMVTLLCLFS